MSSTHPDGTLTIESEEAQLRTARTTSEVAQLKAQVARLASDKAYLYSELTVAKAQIRELQAAQVMALVQGVKE